MMDMVAGSGSGISVIVITIVSALYLGDILERCGMVLRWKELIVEL